MLRVAVSRYGTRAAIGQGARFAGNRLPGVAIASKRKFADKPSEPLKDSIKKPEPAILPGTDSKTAKVPVPNPPSLKPVTPSLSAAVPPKAAPVPITPMPTPKGPPTPTSTPPAGTIVDAVKPLPKKRHRFRNFLLFLTFLTAAGYGGGIWYSLHNDNFHDFFTEFVPFAEDIVLYIEEQQFKRRFPNAQPKLSREQIAKVSTIPKKSGATWKITESDKDKKTGTSDLEKVGPHISALKPKEEGTKEEEEKKKEAAAPAPKASDTPKTEDNKLTVIPPDASVKPKTLSSESTPTPKSAKDHIETTDRTDTQALTKVNVAGHSLAEVDKHDPLIQELAHIINRVISLVNEGEKKVSDKFHPLVTSAKDELGTLNEKIKDIKEATKDSASAALKDQELEFSKVASGLVQRVGEEVEEAQARWRDEYEKDREVMEEAYRSKLKNELDRTNQLSEEKLRNSLVQQAIQMKKKWMGDLKDLVETERNGRLGKLEELEKEVKELENLVSKWSGVIDSDIRTQKLHVAIEALRASISDPQQPRPFLKELAALKELSDEDEVVKVAIASINPKAYQKGLYSPPQIFDRFRRVAVEVRKASLLPEDAGVAGHASSWVFSKLLFRKKGLAQGTDVESILTRTETYLEEGDLDKAAREMNQLQGWAKTLASDWLKEVRTYLEVQQAVEVIAAEARLHTLRRTR